MPKLGIPRGQVAPAVGPEPTTECLGVVPGVSGTSVPSVAICLPHQLRPVVVGQMRAGAPVGGCRHASRAPGRTETGPDEVDHASLSVEQRAW